MKIFVYFLILLKSLKSEEVPKPRKLIQVNELMDALLAGLGGTYMYNKTRPDMR